MRINCIHCGHKFDLGDAYDDYEGMVRCDTCRGGLIVRTQAGSVRSVMPWAVAPLAAPVPEAAPARADADAAGVAGRVGGAGSGGGGGGDPGKRAA